MTGPTETADPYLLDDGYPGGYGPKENVLVWLKRGPTGDEAGDCMDAAVVEIERLHAILKRLVDADMHAKACFIPITESLAFYEVMEEAKALVERLRGFNN